MHCLPTMRTLSLLFFKVLMYSTLISADMVENSNSLITKPEQPKQLEGTAKKNIKKSEQSQVVKRIKKTQLSSQKSKKVTTSPAPEKPAVNSKKTKKKTVNDKSNKVAVEEEVSIINEEVQTNNLVLESNSIKTPSSTINDVPTSKVEAVEIANSTIGIQTDNILVSEPQPIEISSIESQEKNSTVSIPQAVQIVTPVLESQTATSNIEEKPVIEESKVSQKVNQTPEPTMAIIDVPIATHAVGEINSSNKVDPQFKQEYPIFTTTIYIIKPSSTKNNLKKKKQTRRQRLPTKQLPAEAAFVASNAELPKTIDSSEFPILIASKVEQPKTVDVPVIQISEFEILQAHPIDPIILNAKPVIEEEKTEIIILKPVAIELEDSQFNNDDCTDNELCNFKKSNDILVGKSLESETIIPRKASGNSKMFFSYRIVPLFKPIEDSKEKLLNRRAESSFDENSKEFESLKTIIKIVYENPNLILNLLRKIDRHLRHERAIDHMFFKSQFPVSFYHVENRPEYIQEIINHYKTMILSTLKNHKFDKIKIPLSDAIQSLDNPKFIDFISKTYPITIFRIFTEALYETYSMYFDSAFQNIGDEIYLLSDRSFCYGSDQSENEKIEFERIGKDMREYLIQLKDSKNENNSTIEKMTKLILDSLNLLEDSEHSRN